MNASLIAPSLLSADQTRLGEEVASVLMAGADLIHLDVMDNHYVPNLSFGPATASSLQSHFPEIILDIHLMTSPVDNLISNFIQSGAKRIRISIHPDATVHLDRSLTLIKQNQCQVGLALNPSTSPECLFWCHHQLDFVLVMAVNPGFGGQKLLPNVIKKIQWIKNHFPQLAICVDGGISLENIRSLAQAGANQFVIGSGLFSYPDSSLSSTSESSFAPISTHPGLSKAPTYFNVMQSFRDKLSDK